MTKDGTRISIIIPAYNVEKYIDAALNSVFSQEMPAHEVIIVNDGSTDRTLEIIKKYDIYPQLKLITTDNQGAGPARNEGFKHASGDYIYFFDADDLMHPRLIATVAFIIKRDNMPELIMFSGECFLEYGVSQDEFDELGRGFDIREATGVQVLEQMIHIDKVDTFLGMMVINREFWNNKKFLVKPIVCCQDVELFPHMLLSSKRVVVASKVLFYRRVRPLSIQTSPRGKRHRHAYLVVALSILELYKNSKDRPRIIRNYLKRHIERHVNRYLKFSYILDETIEKSCVIEITRTLHSFKTLRRLIRFYILSSARNIFSGMNVKCI